MKHITDLKNIYKDKRCFVMGTGPSLKLEQLAEFIFCLVSDLKGL